MVARLLMKYYVSRIFNIGVPLSVYCTGFLNGIREMNVNEGIRKREKAWRWKFFMIPEQEGFHPAAVPGPVF